MKFATRMNSFLKSGISMAEALHIIGRIDGVDYVDLNYPEHFAGQSLEELKALLEESHLRCNAVNLRFRDMFLNGEFGNRDQGISKEAVKLCKEAADACKALGGKQMIIWLGFDGYDYSFQVDYVKVLSQVVQCFQEVCDYTDLPVSVEYKPYEERVFALIDSFGTAMLLLDQVKRDNFGITLDFCHMLMKKENPAFAVSWLLDHGKLFNMHLNDGEGSCDDGLMVGMVNLWKTAEVFYLLEKYGFDGAVYFDTFPKREGAEQECRANMAMCRAILSMVERYGLERMGQVIESNDAVKVNEMMVEMLSR